MDRLSKTAAKIISKILLIIAIIWIGFFVGGLLIVYARIWWDDWSNSDFESTSNMRKFLYDVLGSVIWCLPTILFFRLSQRLSDYANN